jgi:glycerol-3-phosphate acyltransferase PlsY
MLRPGADHRHLSLRLRSRSMRAVPKVVSLAGAVGIGYLLGTFPTADLVARRATGGATDLRRSGSGNPGSANALAVLGPRAGATVLVGDIGKGVLACALGAAVSGPAGAQVAGSAAVAGHCYPVWSNFDGGKGVATSVGQCLATFPAYFAIDAAVAISTAVLPGWRRRAFAATNVSSACWVIGAIVWWRRGWSNAWGPTPTALLPRSVAASSAMILQRFLAGERQRTAVA